MIKGRMPVRGWLQTPVKDGDDVRSLVVAVTGEGCVGWWAMLREWQLRGGSYSGVCGNGCVAGGVSSEV